MILLELPDALSNPLLWLAFSCFLLAIALTAVLMAALPTLLELARVSRSAEKLLDTLNRELPQTLEALRMTGSELGELTEEVSEGVQSASRTVQRVDQSFASVQKQAQTVSRATRSAFVGVKAAWKTFLKPSAAQEFTEATEPLPETTDTEEYVEENGIVNGVGAIVPATPHTTSPSVNLPPVAEPEESNIKSD
ncbi:DUF948 domain-containing protein [Vacuolonema iberomarrocanum]|uniref:DUF948 domain-containing protein n=1 Tax=Vacuolonema iberomarrocanum TaxID=3454632 RepID=UPI0019FD2603|nr:DUF948 domain-containing protein [filamentous cyanobacterium LEGE 07170]